MPPPPADPGVVAVAVPGDSPDEVCAREPIQIPGAIQPHGLLLALGEDNRVVVASENVATLLGRRHSVDPLVALTPREREVLELMATGASNQGIADALVITLRAAEKYVSTIFAKLGIPSTRSESRRVLAVLQYLRA